MNKTFFKNMVLAALMTLPVLAKAQTLRESPLSKMLRTLLRDGQQLSYHNCQPSHRKIRLTSLTTVPLHRQQTTLKLFRKPLMLFLLLAVWS